MAGAIVTIAPKQAKDDKGAFTLTTGPDGTAKAPLPVGKKTGRAYTATETKAPDGYRLDTTPVEITAKPGAETTAALTYTATAKPTATASSSSSPDIGTATSTPTTPDAKPEGSLAHTGADSTNFTTWQRPAREILWSVGSLG
ncbi:prealbumin-like fold domain-containing protein [Streptomyces sp. NPDC012794]|uniref:prealbumin-like fold domain-containing protein n=1 Tax=Streptomyces sp. NPDC012794 TaxID=3364850 RepID=UPI0036B62206